MRAGVVRVRSILWRGQFVSETDGASRGSMRTAAGSPTCTPGCQPESGFSHTWGCRPPLQPLRGHGIQAVTWMTSRNPRSSDSRSCKEAGRALRPGEAGVGGVRLWKGSPRRTSTKNGNGTGPAIPGLR